MARDYILHRRFPRSTPTTMTPNTDPMTSTEPATSAPSPTVPTIRDMAIGEAPAKDSITFKLAPQVREALDRKAAQWGQSAPEFMRAFLNFALQLPDGLVLKLDAASETQPELPLKG